jgi:hypothetical protein
MKYNETFGAPCWLIDWDSFHFALQSIVNKIKHVSLVRLVLLIRILEYRFSFNIHGSVPRNNILLYKPQQGAHVTEFILSDSCSTCFGRYYHPSAGAQTTVTTASGSGYTVLLSATIVEECNRYQMLWLQLSVLLQMGDSNARNT